jgi:ABC-type transport system involved in Fe-S cluster assembly fused permease/ATPase subunit
VTSGKIFIDSKGIREYTRDSQRRCLGIALQDTYIQIKHKLVFFLQITIILQKTMEETILWVGTK